MRLRSEGWREWINIEGRKGDGDASIAIFEACVDQESRELLERPIFVNLSNPLGRWRQDLSMLQ